MKTPSGKLTVYVAAMLTIVATISVIFRPEVAFSASRDGLILWFDVVLPALFPFFVMAELMMGIGVIHGIGVLIEPFMRPVFRIPGVGGFAVAMGLASGYPLGAKISGRLRRDGHCTQIEGERLIAFANTADPLFMVGAVAIGMFGMPEIGVTIAVSHYIAAILVGFLMRFHGGRRANPPQQSGERHVRSGMRREPLMARALRVMVDSRNKDGRSFGDLFGDAVKQSMQSMLFIGGCIIMFNVALQVAESTGLLLIFAGPTEQLLSMMGLSPGLAPALWQGLMEITIGAKATAEAPSALRDSVIVAGGIIGWSGISVHAQVAAMIHGTDLRLAPYLLARFTHGVLAAAITALFFNVLTSPNMISEVMSSRLPQYAPLWILWGGGAMMAAIVILSMLLISLIVHHVRGLRIIFFNVRR